MSLVGYPKVIVYTEFEHFEIIFVFELCSDISMKNALTDPVPFSFSINPLAFESQNSITSRVSQDHSPYQV